MNQYTGQPECKTHVYELNDVTGYYEKKIARPGFEKLPYELKVEDTRKRQQIRADLICRGKIKNGKYLFFTGLLPVGNGTLFFGDNYEIINGYKKNSFILFLFSNGNRTLKIFYFNHFKVYPGQRAKFISDFFRNNPQ